MNDTTIVDTVDSINQHDINKPSQIDTNITINTLNNNSRLSTATTTFHRLFSLTSESSAIELGHGYQLKGPVFLNLFIDGVRSKFLTIISISWILLLSLHVWFIQGSASTCEELIVINTPICDSVDGSFVSQDSTNENGTTRVSLMCISLIFILLGNSLYHSIIWLIPSIPILSFLLYDFGQDSSYCTINSFCSLSDNIDTTTPATCLDNAIDDCNDNLLFFPSISVIVGNQMQFVILILTTLTILIVLIIHYLKIEFNIKSWKFYPVRVLLPAVFSFLALSNLFISILIQLSYINQLINQLKEDNKINPSNFISDITKWSDAVALALQISVSLAYVLSVAFIVQNVKSYIRDLKKELNQLIEIKNGISTRNDDSDENDEGEVELKVKSAIYSPEYRLSWLTLGMFVGLFIATIIITFFIYWLGITLLMAFITVTVALDKVVPVIVWITKFVLPIILVQISLILYKQCVYSKHRWNFIVATPIQNIRRSRCLYLIDFYGLFAGLPRSITLVPRRILFVTLSLFRIDIPIGPWDSIYSQYCDVVRLHALNLYCKEGDTIFD